MTHDPLCPFFYDQTGRELVRQTGNPCTYCDLIARVREDERTNEPPAWAYANGYAAAVRDALIAVYEIQDDKDSSTEWDRDYDVDPTGDTRSPRIWLREAMAAIESLRSKH